MTDRLIDDPHALQAYLVRLAMEAVDRVAADVGLGGGPPLYRVALEGHLRERMAQAAMTIGLEVEALREVAT